MDFFLKKRNRSLNSENNSNINNNSINSIKNSYSFKLKNGITYILKQDDLTSQNTNVIVNAANNELHLGGGVAGAIRKKGGYKIQEECKKIISQRGRQFDNGEVIHTGIGDFKNDNLKYIFHAVGPVYYNGKRNEAHELKKTFLNCFRLSEKLNVESISLPPISSGIFGYPKDECAEIFYKCFEIYGRHKLKHRDDDGGSLILKEIRMTIIDRETYKVFVEVHHKKIENFKEIFGDDLIVEENFEAITESIENKKDSHNEVKVDKIERKVNASDNDDNCDDILLNDNVDNVIEIDEEDMKKIIEDHHQHEAREEYKNVPDNVKEQESFDVNKQETDKISDAKDNKKNINHEGNEIIQCSLITETQMEGLNLVDNKTQSEDNKIENYDSDDKANQFI